MDGARFKALTFDCYGTLIDWERGILEVLRPWAEKCGLGTGDGELLEAFARAESEIECANPDLLYREILAAVHVHIGRTLGGEVTPDDARRLGDSVGDWPPFPDTVAALRRLKERFTLVVVSNVDRASFAQSQARLGITFDAAVLAEDVGVYKPDPRMFFRALSILQGLGIRKTEVLHVAQSLYHDHVPAQEMGLATVWIDRRAGQEGSGATRVPARPVTPDAAVRSLSGLVTLLERSR